MGDRYQNRERVNQVFVFGVQQRFEYEYSIALFGSLVQSLPNRFFTLHFRCNEYGSLKLESYLETLSSYFPLSRVIHCVALQGQADKTIVKQKKLL